MYAAITAFTERQKNRHSLVNKNYFYLTIIIGLILLTAGCTGFVSVHEKFSGNMSSTDVYEVRKGDTLFSVAWRYGWDHKALARANGIRHPYTIYPGQKLNVSHDRPVAKSSKPANSKTLTKRKPSIKTNVPSAYKTRQKTTKPEISSAMGDWHWPADGDVIAKYSTKKPVNKGIDIAGRLGESVYSAAAGTVVYAGSGLLGYGNLVIIKHNQEFLSAYAHNKKLLVKENQQVKARQPIAEIGSSGTDQVKLHFEIRRRGKPVDPLKYLPKK
ncbi:peptidoglycan DD-metalloendopeptidase family protein [Bermanella marisrubri]|uniref:Peptidase M23/LysM domain protein n=1 Tax=Bermanella marisrubri TaxID=207949 RepID=Q1N1K1_9GAMM|nr:peptidoglycan DD-metalloendopeptidase family protein [Bermanella marisrubri]EAT12049.1 peptidase M23/LysM domain protein [Oceanobacter sp. RED65] [Bermanella marisrubri]QIZ83520.1 peptidoglycan DD-metalloendopeptidase family protein [Bermanella marisrubri]